MLARGSAFDDLATAPLDRFSEAVAAGAGEFYHYSCEAARVGFPQNGGLLLWVWKRQWPNAGIQIVDGLGRPLSVYYDVKRAYGSPWPCAMPPQLNYAPGDEVELPLAVLGEAAQPALKGLRMAVRLLGPDLKERQSWRDLPKIHLGDCGWAPASVKIGQEYSLIGSRLGRVTSKDLNAWTDQGRLNAKGGNRDPFVLFWDGTFFLLRCDGNGVSAITSPDFVAWSDPVTIYKPKKESYQTESPVLVPYGGLFYLFWTLWDTADKTTSGYCPRSYVHCSESPMDFHDKPVLAEFTAHAPEVILDEGGQWFISSADYPHRGVSVAPLSWE
jgi:hypothetical protein